MATTVVYAPLLDQYPIPTMSGMNVNVDTGQSSGSYSRHPHDSQRFSSQTYGQDAYSAPVTGSSASFDQTSAQAGPSRRQGSAIQRDIDGMEHQTRGMTISEPTDGRVGTEDPSEFEDYRVYLAP